MAAVSPTQRNGNRTNAPDSKHACGTISVDIAGMTCASCVRRVEQALQAITGVDAATVNLATERAEVTFSSSPNAAAVENAVKCAGYELVGKTTELAIQGMSCASCVARIEKALAAVAGVQQAQVNLASEKARVRYVAGLVDTADLTAAVRAAGYDAQRLADNGDNAVGAQTDEIASLKRSVFLAAAATLPIFLLEMGSHMSTGLHGWLMAGLGQQNLFYLFFVLASLVQFGPGLRFYRKGLPALLHGRPEMNSLVMLGTSAAYGYSLVATFLPSVLARRHGQRLLRGVGDDRRADPFGTLFGGGEQGPHRGGYQATDEPAGEDSASRA